MWGRFEKAEHNIYSALWPRSSVPVPVRVHWLWPTSTSEGLRCTEQAAPAGNNTWSNDGKVLVTLQLLIAVSLHRSIELLLLCKIMVNLQKEFWAVGVRSRCDKCISCRTCSMTQIYDWCHIGSNFFKARGWKNSRRVGKKQYAQKTFPYLSTHCFKGHRTRNFPFLERARCESQQVHVPAEMCSPSAPSLLPAIASAFCSCMTDDAWKEGDELCHVSASAACV